MIHKRKKGYNKSIAKEQEGQEKMGEEYRTINNVLVSLINEIWKLEGDAIITREFADITNNDMHVIEAVGLGDGGNMSSIAKKLSVTVGTLTIAMNNLVNKKYVERRRSEKDRRVVLVRLTDRGIAAYRHHEDYHRQMTEAILKKIDRTELPVLMKMLDAVTEFFKGYNK